MISRSKLRSCNRLVALPFQNAPTVPSRYHGSMGALRGWHERQASFLETVMKPGETRKMDKLPRIIEEWRKTQNSP
jgi:hypothetical protein